MRMTRHTHNATRHTGGAYTNTNTTARGQGAGHARRGLFIYGLRHHCTLHLLSAQMRLRGGDHGHPPRPQLICPTRRMCAPRRRRRRRTARSARSLCGGTAHTRL